jgi:hypothetical protein
VNLAKSTCSSTQEILVQSASVPAGTYHELLLQFLPDTPADPGALPAATTTEIACSWLTAASRSFISRATATRLSFSCPCNTTEAAHSLSCPAQPSIYGSRCSRSRSPPPHRRNNPTVTRHQTTNGGMFFAKGTPDLMQGLPCLPATPHVALLRRRKPKPFPSPHKTPPLKTALYQMVLHRPSEPAAVIGQVKISSLNR